MCRCKGTFGRPIIRAGGSPPEGSRLLGTRAEERPQSTPNSIAAYAASRDGYCGTLLFFGLVRFVGRVRRPDGCCRAGLGESANASELGTRRGPEGNVALGAAHPVVRGTSWSRCKLTLAAELGRKTVAARRGTASDLSGGSTSPRPTSSETAFSLFLSGYVLI